MGMFDQARRHIVGMHHSSSAAAKVDGVPKGQLAVYVGENVDKKNRLVIPVSYVNHPLFQELLRMSEEEYGFHHPMGGLTIPCTQTAFNHVIATIKL